MNILIKPVITEKMTQAESDENILLSSRNIKNTKVINLHSLNTYQLMHANRLMFIESSINELQKNSK